MESRVFYRFSDCCTHHTRVNIRLYMRCAH